jgi:hypothetical protein
MEFHYWLEFKSNYTILPYTAEALVDYRNAYGTIMDIKDRAKHFLQWINDSPVYQLVQNSSDKSDS